MEDLILSGDIINIMLAVIVIEIVAIIAYRRYRGGGIPAIPLLMNVGAGSSLMLALRASLTDAEWMWIAGFLLASLVFHVADQLGRWEQPAPRQTDRDSGIRPA